MQTAWCPTHRIQAIVSVTGSAVLGRSVRTEREHEGDTMIVAGKLACGDKYSVVTSWKNYREML